MLTRTRPNSFALSGAFTRSVQTTGRSIGQGDKMALIVGQDAVGQDTDRVPLVRLDHDPLERLEVGVLAEEVHLADRSVQHMVHLPAGCFSRCSWHG